MWLDEIEKALPGATSGSADGGVSADALGAVLSWMQERQGEAFVIATANDVTGLPPELLRKGRFDEVWFIDLPNESERQAILSTALKAHNRADVQIDSARVSSASDGFTGSEIAALVPDALFAAFGNGTEPREIATDDLITAARSIVPLTKTMGDKLTRLREWASGRARMATSTIASRAASTTRQLDI